MCTKVGRPPEHGATVLAFRRQHHGATAGADRACIATRTSTVISIAPRSAASATISAHRSEGIFPRERQLLTTDGATFRACATSEVPPNAVMTESGVMAAGIFTFCEAVKRHAMAIAPSILAGHDLAMAKRYAQIGKRLEQLRKVLGISQAELCRQIKCQPNRWNQYKSGERRITLPIAIRLADSYGASLDWIYRGEVRTLTQEMFAKLQQAA